MSISISSFGALPDGRAAALFTLTNPSGAQLCLTDYGARIVAVRVPDRTGNLADVALGFDSAADYIRQDNYIGATIGRVGNRIAGSAFTLNGKDYHVDANEGPNCLHGGHNGFDRQLWHAEPHEGEAADMVTFTYTSADGEEGFPGTLRVTVSIGWSHENDLSICYSAVCDQDTLCNLTNHSYFNLDGHGAGSIEEHELWLGASHFTPVVPGAIPTGEIRAVAGTPLDFTQAKKIGRDIREDYEQLLLTGGYDHNFVIDGWDGTLRHIATVKGPKSGRVMKAYTTLPGVQFYAGNFIDEQSGKEGVTYGNRCGFALETQYFPDTIHHENFPSYVFGGENGREYDCVTVYKFEV